MTRRDAHGQPIAPFPAALIQNHGKAVDQLIGIARGIMCDDAVSDAEAVAFRKFVERFFEMERVFPFDALKERMDRIFADGQIEAEEREELRVILRSLGGLTDDPELGPENIAATFPLDEPAPEVRFTENEFVVTGRFALGTRARVHEIIGKCGGQAHDNVRHTTRYLVIGHFASRDWLHTSYGLKIARAAELRKERHPVAIISEAHLRASLPPIAGSYSPSSVTAEKVGWRKAHEST